MKDSNIRIWYNALYFFFSNQRPQKTFGSWPAPEIFVRRSQSLLMFLPLRLEHKLFGLIGIKQQSMQICWTVYSIQMEKKPLVINKKNTHFYLLLQKGFRLWSWTSDSGMSYLRSLQCDHRLTMQKRITKYPQNKEP